MKPRLKAEEAQHQPALLPELPGLQAQFTQDTAHKAGDGEHPGSGYKDQAGDKARNEEGAVLSDLRHQKHEHRADQDGVDEVGGEPHIGADAAHQHKEKADGDTDRPQRAGRDGVLGCQFPLPVHSLLRHLNSSCQLLVRSG